MTSANESSPRNESPPSSPAGAGGDADASDRAARGPAKEGSAPRTGAAHGAGADEPAGKKGQTALGVLGFVLALGFGFLVGKWINRPDTHVEPVAQDRVRVALRGDEPTLGPEGAWVTVIEFADFECPYCAKGAKPLLDAIEDMDEGDVRLIFKHYPLPFHRKAVPAARAAYAGHKFGKFWELHDYLYEHRGDVTDLRSFVESLGLDPDAFMEVMFSDEAMKAVDDDMVAGGRAGVSGTPAYVVNGLVYTGARSKAQWKEILKAAKEDAERLGVPRAEVYATLMKDAKDRLGDGAPVGGKPSARAPARQPGEADPSARYKVPAGDDRPSLGPADAKVTLVLFSDFECPFCRRLAPVVVRLAREQGDLRVVFRNFPLPSHPKARAAAKAAMAAHRQGKFWAYHDRLFSYRGPLSDAAFEKIAAEAGLDVERFRKDLEDPAVAAAIDEDVALGKRFGVVATPTMFVNGRYIRGAQSAKSLLSVVENARKEADRILAEGGGEGRPYDRIVRDALDRVAPAEGGGGTP